MDPKALKGLTKSETDKSMRIEQIGQLRTALGECPVWDAEESRLWMADCRKGLIYALDVETGRFETYELPAPIGSFALNAQDELVVALKEDFALYRLADRSIRILANIGDSHPNLRLNDGSPLPDGSFVAGTMHVFREPGQAPLGGLYRLDQQGRLTRLACNFGVVNGPVMHPDLPYFFVADSSERKIYRYAIRNHSELTDPQVFVDTSALQTAPDGCCFDSNGGLWMALVHAGAIARFDESGMLTDRIDLPVRHPASLCFGGPQLADIFVTTISDSGRLKADGALDGALLRIQDSGYRGAPRQRCAISA